MSDKVTCTVENTKVGDVVVGISSLTEYTVTAVGTRYLLAADDDGIERCLYPQSYHHKPPETFALPPVGSVVEVLIGGEWYSTLVLTHFSASFGTHMSSVNLGKSNEGIKWRRK